MNGNGEKLYKILAPGRKSAHGGTAAWTPGEWMPPIVDIKPCERGYHLCRVQDLPHWIGVEGAEVWEAEYRGERIDENDKICVSEARITRRLKWNDRLARHWMADNAERVAHLVSDEERPKYMGVISVMRRYADGNATEAELASARASACASARESAWESARESAWESASSASGRDSAWASACASAWESALESAWASARASGWESAWKSAWASARASAWESARESAYCEMGQNMVEYLEGRKPAPRKKED